MFLRWLAATRGRENPTAFSKHSLHAIVRLGELIEAHPNAYMDESWLPLSKDQMKLCLKVAISTTRDQARIELLKNGWVMLAMFQPGVGPKPIGSNLPPDFSKQEVTAHLEPHVVLVKAAQLEMQNNLRDAHRFVASRRQ